MQKQFIVCTKYTTALNNHYAILYNFLKIYKHKEMEKQTKNYSYYINISLLITKHFTLLKYNVLRHNKYIFINNLS